MTCDVRPTELAVAALDLTNILACDAVDAFVVQAAGNTPFHLTCWSRAVERACGVKSHYLVAEGAAGIRAVLPCHMLNSFWFGRAMVSCGFAVEGGLLGDEPALIDAMLSCARAEKARVVLLRGGDLIPEEWETDETNFVRFRRPLAQSDMEELERLPRKRRAEIRQAQAAGLVARVGRAPTDLRDHYRVFSESVRNLGTPVFPAALFREVLAEFGAAADIVTIIRDGQPIASVLSIYHQGVAYPYWGGGTAAARSCHANALLYYALMCHARVNHGCTAFDFGRSTRGSGPARFKEGFGFTPIPLVYARQNLRATAPKNGWTWQNRFGPARACWRRLPLPVANACGPLISKALG